MTLKISFFNRIKNCINARDTKSTLIFNELRLKLFFERNNY